MVQCYGLFPRLSDESYTDLDLEFTPPGSELVVFYHSKMPLAPGLCHFEWRLVYVWVIPSYSRILW